MQEKVCIVLNERESNKAKAAESLSARLKEIGITASRINVDENIIKILLQKKPKILILDYLLGDFSTGLDVLLAMQKLDPAQRPRTIFLTDEPSVPVAVEAMRLGAINYFEVDHPQALSQTVREIVRLIESMPSTKVPEAKKQGSLDDLVAQSRSTLDLINRAQVLIKAYSPIVLICGRPGSGRTTIATTMHAERLPFSTLSTIDLRYFDQSCSTEDSAIRKALQPNCSLLIENAEDDDGTVLEAISTLAPKIWPNRNAKQSNSFLTVCFNNQGLCAAWNKRLTAETLTISSLDQRKEEVPLLVQRFVREAQELSDLKLKPFDSSVCDWLSTLDWPGDLKQLRNCVIHAAIDAALNEADLRKSVELQRECWSQGNLASELSIEPYSAALTLESVNHSYRIAAAKLGCSIRELREVLK